MKPIPLTLSNRLLQQTLRICLFLLLVANLFFQPTSALAALGITSVTPNSISNASAVTITHSDTEFSSGAVAKLAGYGDLSTSFEITTTLPITTPVATESPMASYKRPVIVVQAYSSSVERVKFGQDFSLDVRLYNAGQKMAMNVVATFLSSDAVPRQTGGVIAIPEIAPDNRYEMSQPMTAGSDMWGKSSAAIELNIAYTDDAGNVYSEKFNLAVPLQPPSYTAPTATPTPSPTPTAAPANRAQLVITSYNVNPTPLQPGSQFNLELEISNQGNAPAKRVTMIVGGGSIAVTTETPGGVSGGGGEFSNFAPLGVSNIQSLGDLELDGKLQAVQPLVVNVSTNPGAFPLKISFTYLNEKGNPVMDEQVITLLVYALPNMEISFYRDPNPIFAGQENMLPLQIVNLGHKSAVLGNMTVASAQGQVNNATMLIGTLDPGGYFTLDASLFPNVAGPLDLTVTVDYTDDFNQPRQIVKTLNLEVLEAMQPEMPVEPVPGQGETPGNAGGMPETFWQKVARFFLGLIGLDSAQQQSSGGVMPPVKEEVPASINDGGSRPLKGP